MDYLKEYERRYTDSAFDEETQKELIGIESNEKEIVISY